MSPTTGHATTAGRLNSLAAPYIAALARDASGNDGFEAISWDIEPLAGGFGSAVGGTALFRITVRAGSGETCSLVLKVLYERKDEKPTSPYYWKREYEVYRSGILDRQPDDSFSTPRIYSLQDHGDSCWIWMEDIQDSKDTWSLDEFRNIARRLGRFNGAWLTRSSLPSDDWLPTNWHSAIIPALSDAFVRLDQMLDSPLARLALPFDAKEEIEAIWHDRRRFQAALAQLPRTFCHTDAFRRNILHRNGEAVLLDWALASIGALGEELVCLVAVSLYYEGFTAAYADRLEQTVFAGYIEGLRQAGWSGDPHLARLGFACGMVLRGLAGVKQDLLLLNNQAGHDQLLRTHRMTDIHQLARLFADVRRFRLLKMAREARDLLAR